MQYQHLNGERVLDTLKKLHTRITERFPNAGLTNVCADLVGLARFTTRDAARLAKPNYFWRLASLALIVCGMAAQIFAFRFIHVDAGSISAPELIQGLEAAVNLLILFGGAVWFLLTLEERWKRQRALDSLHRLRSLAHVVDMHQLTKDPTALISGANRTAASPERTMTRFELTRYLDYCAEMLALISKLGALYGERTRDNVVISAVNDVEDLTTGLGRKIWQKITMIGAIEN